MKEWHLFRNEFFSLTKKLNGIHKNWVVPEINSFHPRKQFNLQLQMLIDLFTPSLPEMSEQ